MGRPENEKGLRAAPHMRSRALPNGGLRKRYPPLDQRENLVNVIIKAMAGSGKVVLMIAVRARGWRCTHPFGLLINGRCYRVWRDVNSASPTKPPRNDEIPNT
jgi:hypothetical protein